MPQNLEVTKKLYTSLKRLNLSIQEIDLYIASLTIGPTTIESLAKKINVSRPNVYKVIAKLERNGLAEFSTRKKYARTFVVAPPTKALELLREKEKQFEDADKNLVSTMPDLMAHFHQGETPTKIKVLHGEEQYLKIFDQILEEATDGGEFFGSTKDFIGFITWEKETRWIKKRMEKGFYIKILTLPSETADQLQKTDSEQMRETRILNMQRPFEASFQLFGNKAIFWQPKAPLALLIEDEYIVKILKSVFYTLWEQSK